MHDKLLDSLQRRRANGTSFVCDHFTRVPILYYIQILGWLTVGANEPFRLVKIQLYTDHSAARWLDFTIRRVDRLEFHLRTNTPGSFGPTIWRCGKNPPVAGRIHATSIATNIRRLFFLNPSDYAQNIRPVKFPAESRLPSPRPEFELQNPVYHTVHLAYAALYRVHNWL